MDGQESMLPGALTEKEAVWSRHVLSYLFYRMSCNNASIGTRLSWRLGKILIEFFHYGSRLCNIFIADVAMFDQGRTSALLVELQTW